ncbi:2,' 3'-cyclic nucleotide 2'-phosphodiesterase [Paenibacillus sp. FSL K6-1230]|uniref:2,' 3'-cyclic nucleotide 2'-phosphodiesterase n=1 Tax=Paenibacillus sp. FSL K6-1230 TaxID=2921603 RepID=UPI0030FA96B3
MNKKMYLGVGVLLGAILATAGGAAAEQINSLIGKAVDGEYNVRVNGSALSESAIVVDGKAHVPLRAVSDSLGADLVVNGKTIEIRTNAEPNISTNTEAKSEVVISNPYSHLPKNLIEEKRDNAAEWVVALERDIDSYEKAISRVDKRISAAGDDQNILDHISKSVEEDKAKLDDAKSKLVEVKNDLKLLNEALANK